MNSLPVPTLVAQMPQAGPRLVLVSDQPTFAFVNLSSGTATTGQPVSPSNTFSVTSPAYTFVGPWFHLERIVSAQCNRVNKLIYSQLEQLDRSDDDRNEDIVDKIASIIDLVGEPASCTAAIEAKLLEDDPFTFERLLLAIATAHHKETEADRLKLLREYAAASDHRIKWAAVRALGRMNTEDARNTLQEISAKHGSTELSYLATALLR
jgi:hypothetical protein